MSSTHAFRTRARALALTTVLVSTLTLVPASAGQVALARNLRFVTGMPFANATHLEMVTRQTESGLRSYAFVGSRDGAEPETAGLRIVDVTDPEDPVLVSHVECAQHNNDVAISPDGTTALLTSDGASGSGCRVQDPEPGFRSRVRDFAIVDIRDISNPRLLGTPPDLPQMNGVHTATFHPREAIAYMSTQNTPERRPLLWILDFRSGSVQVRSAEMPPVGSSPHDITFSRDGTRAYVAAVTASYILDTTDPLAPSFVSAIVDPTINIHHEAFLSPNGRYVLIVDEQAGALANPACPGGGVHVYDLAAGETRPIPVGAFFADDTRLFPAPTDPNQLPACTAHEGSFSADGSLLSMGWFEGGARLFDVRVLNATDVPAGAPVGMQVEEIGFARMAPASDAWAAKFVPTAPGYIIVSDTVRGLDVLKVDSSQ